jgi:hypothetical protein
MNYTLKNIVKEFLIENGDNSMNRYPKFYQFGVNFLRENNMDVSGLPKIESLDVSDTDTVDLPIDYLQYTRIAICGKDGLLHSLGRNSNLSLDKHYGSCGQEIWNPDRQQTATSPGFGIWGNGFASTADHIRNGEITGSFFGIGGGNNANGYYRIDTANNQIKLGGLICHTHHIILEYIADISAINEDYSVHPFIIEALKSSIAFQDLKRSKNASLGAISEAERRLWRDEKTAQRRFNATTAEEWKSAFRSGNFGSPKW